jgi:hypothetical protein
MSEVWQAHDRELDRPCALKFILAIWQPMTASALACSTKPKLPPPAHGALRAVLGVGEHEGALYLPWSSWKERRSRPASNVARD